MSKNNDEVIDFDSVEEMGNTDYDFDQDITEQDFEMDEYQTENSEVEEFEVPEVEDTNINNTDEPNEPDVDDAEVPLKKKSNWFKENPIILGMAVVVLPVLSWFIYSIVNPPAPEKPAIQERVMDEPNVQSSNFAKTISDAQSIPDNSSSELSNANVAKVNPVPQTIVQGVSEDDVIEIVEPLVQQLNKLSSSINEINQYLNSQKSESANVQQQLSENNLNEIKSAINAGLDQTEAFLLKEIETTNSNLSALQRRLKAVESKKDELAKRKPLTMITATDGVAKLKVTGTDNEFTITNGEKIKGYGLVQKVGPWGCLHLSTGEKFQPENASCED